jgi:hypothetical protein
MLSARMVIATVTEFKNALMEKYIEESTMAALTVMDSLNIRITMSMTVNSIREVKEKEYSRRHQLEELKEDFMNLIKSKKSLK